MSPLLSAEVAAQLEAVRRVASALCGATASPAASFSHAAGTLIVTPDADTIGALHEAGTTLAVAADALTTAIETQLIEFFNHMREKEAKSIATLLSPRSLVPDGYTERCTKGDADYRHHSDGKGSSSSDDGEVLYSTPRQRNSKRSVPHNAPFTQQVSTHRTAATALRTALHLMMESMLTHTDASCAALFISDSTHTNDSTRMLHCVAHINGDNRVPRSISFASPSSLITVVRTGIALHFAPNDSDNTCRMSSANKSARSASGAKGDSVQTSFSGIDSCMRHPLRCRRAVVLPLGSYGCALLADKSTDFTESDEHIIWALTTLCEGLFDRYSRDLLIEHRWPPTALGALRQCSLRPPVPAQPQSAAKSVLSCSLDITALPKRLTIVYAKSGQAGPITDTKDMRQRDMSQEQIYQDAAKHIVNLEAVWHQSLKELNEMRNTCVKGRSELEERGRRIAALEAELVRSNKQTNSNSSTVKGAQSCHRK